MGSKKSDNSAKSESGAKAGDNAGKALAEAMNGLLADSFALYLKT